MTSFVILAVEVWISWVMICEFRGSSAPSPFPGCKTSSYVWSVVLIGLGIFHVIDVSWILELKSPRHFSVALSCFISFGNSSAVIFIKHDILQVHEKVHLLFWVSFVSHAKLSVLESDP
jgi:hypothetical protein